MVFGVARMLLFQGDCCVGLCNRLDAIDFRQDNRIYKFIAT